MLEFLHFDIQSTGQKSRCVSTGRRPSQSFVLIKQSDSPCPRQFWVARTRLPGPALAGGSSPDPRWARRRRRSDAARAPVRARPHRLGKGPERAEPQSQSFYRRYGSVLPTSLTYIVLSARGFAPRRPAADTGTRSREINGASLGFSRADPGAPDGARAAPLCGLTRTRSPVDPIPGSALRDGPHQEKRTLPGARAGVSEFAGVTASIPAGRAGAVSVSRLENIDSIPFRPPGIPRGDPRLTRAFARALGAARPRSTAVHVEPFSTSAFKVLA